MLIWKIIFKICTRDIFYNILRMRRKTFDILVLTFDCLYKDNIHVEKTNWSGKKNNSHIFLSLCMMF